MSEAAARLAARLAHDEPEQSAEIPVVAVEPEEEQRPLRQSAADEPGNELLILRHREQMIEVVIHGEHDGDRIAEVAEEVINERPLRGRLEAGLLLIDARRKIGPARPAAELALRRLAGFDQRVEEKIVGVGGHVDGQRQRGDHAMRVIRVAAALLAAAAPHELVDGRGVHRAALRRLLAEEPRDARGDALAQPADEERGPQVLVRLDDAEELGDARQILLLDRRAREAVRLGPAPRQIAEIADQRFEHAGAEDRERLAVLDAAEQRRPLVEIPISAARRVPDATARDAEEEDRSPPVVASTDGAPRDRHGAVDPAVLLHVLEEHLQERARRRHADIALHGDDRGDPRGGEARPDRVHQLHGAVARALAGHEHDEPRQDGELAEALDEVAAEDDVGRPVGLLQPEQRLPIVHRAVAGEEQDVVALPAAQLGEHAVERGRSPDASSVGSSEPRPRRAASSSPATSIGGRAAPPPGR